MCGIVGHFAFSESCRIDEVAIRHLNDLLFHRGPDSEGSYVNGSITLAMRRLSIISLQGGKQPFFSDDGRFVLIFNGEIYNYKELRTSLLAKGYPLKTTSDTEALLYLFIDSGSKCLEQLNGMFVFAIWDNLKKEIFLARDRLGIKPLYFALNAKRMLFASELTPLLASGFFSLEFEPQALSNYLAYWYICEPQTLFENIFQLAPGSFATVTSDGEMTTSKYWEIPNGPENSNLSFKEATEQLNELLRDAVNLQTRADVPYGTFLSGGIDSGLVTALVNELTQAPVQSFSVGFKDPSYSELGEAKRTAKHLSTGLLSYQIDTLNADTLDKIIQSLDEPLGNASYVPTWFLGQLAGQHVKVVLTGDGGDELFGGYPTYQAPYYQRMYRWVPSPLRGSLNSIVQNLPTSHRRISFDYRLKKLMRGISLTSERGHYTWREIVSLDLQKKLFKSSWVDKLGEHDPFVVADAYFSKAKSLSRINQFMYVDLNTYLLNDHLRKVDRMTMAHSVEARVPYLDHRIVEFAMSLPASYKVSFSKTKRILKEVARQRLPTQIINGSKKGLTSPIAGWLSGPLRDYAGDKLKGGAVETLFNRTEVDGLLDEHFSKKRDNSRILWGLLTLNVWNEKLTKATNSI